MPDIERLKWHICRACSATFAFDYDTDQHTMQTDHREFDEDEIDGRPAGSN